MYKLIYASVLVILFVGSANCGPLDSGIEYSQFCTKNITRDDSPEQLLCLGYFVGTTKGYYLGFQAKSLYPLKADEIINSNEQILTGKLSELGQAISSGLAFGYCAPPGTTIGSEFRVAIQAIAQSNELHSIPPSAAIMRALSMKMPCR